MFLAPLSRSRLNEKKQEPEPIQKIGSRSHKKMRLLYRLPEDKKHKEIVLLYSSLGKIVSFYDKKTHIILLVLYFLELVVSSGE